MSFESSVPVPPYEALTRIARVLVVDDSEAHRKGCTAICDLFHLHTECVSSGSEAIEAVDRGAFDVVLMDIHMPGMDGVETTRAIRALAGAAGLVPIIAVTADASPAKAKAYLAAGMADVVPKPIPPARLYRAIRDALVGTEVEARAWSAA
jgi:CheY-like chemotaxis protein